MKKVTDIKQLIGALNKDQNVYLMFCGEPVIFTKQFWMSCPLIRIIKYLFEEQIYLEE